MRFEFEKIKSTIYPAFLHVGDYAIALSPELILSLKNSAKPSDAFLESLIQSIAEKNRYLKEMMEAGIAACEEKSVLINRLCKEIASL